MADKFDLLHEDVKELKERVSGIERAIISIDKTLIVNTEQLKEHMRRTAQNEEVIELLKDELKPVTKHVEKVNFLLKIIGVLGMSAGAVYYTLQILKSLGH